MSRNAAKSGIRERARLPRYGGRMELTSESIRPGQPIDSVYALGRPDAHSNATFSDNVNPHLAWSHAPSGTKSFAVVVHDSDAPTVADDVNQPGRRVPHDLPRADFYHWVLVDLPATVTRIPSGAFSSGVSKGGKAGPEVALKDDVASEFGRSELNLRHGLNSYTQWFASDPDMVGDYFGYDGPFPPWNDERTHTYTFTVLALDVERAPVEGSFDGPALLTALEGHILDSAAFTATYRICAE